MTHPRQEPVAPRYASTIALLVSAMIFSPTVLIVSRPLGPLPILLAGLFSAACVIFAWFTLSRELRQERLSIVAQPHH